LKFRAPAIILGAVLCCTTISYAAHSVYAQMASDHLTIIAALFTSINLVSLIIWLRVRHSINTRLDSLQAITRQHLLQQTLDQDRRRFIPQRLQQLVDNFILISAAREEQETALMRSNEFTSTILNNISDAVTVIDPKTHKIIAVNRAFLTLHQLKLTDCIGKNCHTTTNCRSIDPHDSAPCPGQRAIESGEFCHANRMGTVDNQQLILDVRATPITNSNGEVIQLIRVAHDITATIHQQQQIEHMAYHDSLTGLPNRELFKDRLEQALLHSTRNNTSGVIALIDLDKFKHINDTFGHDGGDKLLKIVAQRLLECVRSSDTVARMSGDEFLIIYHDINNDDHAHILAKQIIAALNRPVTLAETEITIAASVGLCFFPKEGANVDKLLKCADKAMYAAKNAGRNTFRMCPSGAQKNSG